MILRRKFMTWAMMAIPAIVVGVASKPALTVGEAIQAGIITEAEAAEYLDRTALAANGGDHGI